MNDPKTYLERGLELFRTLVSENSGLAQELQSTRTEFGLPAEPADELAERRHLEWFLLERPSDTVGGVPVEALFGTWSERVGPELADFGAAFLESLAGAFAVTSTEVQQGVWVQDLFGMGEYPVHEPEAAAELQEGDLLVGRIFPVGDGVFRFSPAVSCFRNTELVQALRRDLEAQRAGRRGVLRIQQLELERLFFGETPPVAEAQVTPRTPLDAERRRLRAELGQAGLDDHVIDGLFAAVSRAAKRDEAGVVTELLNGLAFDTEVDLEVARAHLIDLLNVERRAHLEAPTQAAADQPLDPREALAAFDAGRLQGRDLEGLFQELADDLGLGSLDEDESATPKDDLPGEMAGLVEEFLWDEGREDPTVERYRSPLAPFVAYTRNVKLLDAIGELQLIDYAGRYLLEEAGLRDAAEATAALEALQAFCRWVESQHQEPLWSHLEHHWDSLTADVPRLMATRAEKASGEARPALSEVRAIDGDTAEVFAEGRTEIAILRPHQRDTLRVGDLARVVEDRDGVHIRGALPAVLGSLRPSGSESD